MKFTIQKSTKNIVTFDTLEDPELFDTDGNKIILTTASWLLLAQIITDNLDTSGNRKSFPDWHFGDYPKKHGFYLAYIKTKRQAERLYFDTEHYEWLFQEQEYPHNDVICWCELPVKPTK